jgi:hypothetical protein
MKLLRLSYLLVLTCTSIPALADGPSLIPNGGFETGTTGWGIFIPDESKDKNCRFDVVADSPHSGTSCLRFQSDDFARFCVGTDFIPVQPGDRYRITVWVRAGADAAVLPKTPGFVIRLFLRAGGTDAPGGHMFIAPGGIVTRNTPASGDSKLPTDWTQMQAVVEIPAGVDSVGPGLFTWWTKGSVFADDFSIEKVDASTPLTPVTENGPGPAGASAPATAVDTSPITFTDQDILAALDLDAPGMEKVKAAASATPLDWDAVKSAYLNYRRTASTARWGIMPSDRPANPKEKDDPAGDQVLLHHIRNDYHFPMPAVVDMGKDFNWTYDPVPRSSPAFSAEWTYGPIGRTEFWNALASAYWLTGDEKYAAGWVDSLEDFAAKNPMHYGEVPNVASLWRTLDSAIRISISWPNAYYHFLDSPSFTPQANWTYLKLNYAHAQLLMHDLEGTGRSGNWAATECGGLYIVGTLFPEFRDASAWRDRAVDRIKIEMDKVVPPDGFEAEYTPTYHFVTLDGFRRPLDVAKLNNLSIPDSLRDRIMGMYRAPVLVMDQSGNDVPTNDSKIVSASVQAAAGLKLADDPLLAWAASHGSKGQAPPRSTALPYAGFYAMRGGWKRDYVFLFFRAAPTGMGHQHEDMLEVVMRAWNKTLLFDPGTYPYDSSDWRRFTNGTASHNTIIVDGKWQHRGATKPPVSQPTGNPWVTTPLFDYVAGTYDAGYQQSVYRPRAFDPQVWKGQPDKSVSHTRRVLFLPPYYALVLDTLDGTGNHTIDSHFNLDAPAARLDPTTHAAFSENSDGAQLALYPLEMDNLAVDIVQGQMKPLLGWMPLGHRPIPTVRFRKVQAAPAIFATFLYPYRDQPPAFAATPLPVQGDNLWSRFFKTAQENIEVVLAKNGKDEAFTLTSSLVGAVTADATGLILRQPGGTGPVYAGAVDLRSYKDGQVELSLDQPAPLIFSPQAGGLLCFNPGDAAVTVSVQKPFARSVTLPPQAWTSVSSSGDLPATPPDLFKPLASLSGLSYTDYLKSVADPASTGSTEPIQIKAEKLTLPDKAALLGKVGAEGKVVAKWEDAGTFAAAHIAVPQAGWYRVKIRYCSGEEPVRSLLLNGKPPFAEAEGFSLPSTMGSPPSDGWSNYTNDWRDVMLGADQAAPGWKIYLNKGPCELDLRNDGGGLNLEWLELEPE